MVEISLDQIFHNCIPVPFSGCWLYEWGLSCGYGQVAKNQTGTRIAYKVAYILAYGDVPVGVDLHHKCEVKSCCNPDHLELLTRKEHKAEHAITHCINGHELISDNIYTSPLGYKQCMTCRREADQRRSRRRVRR